MEGREFLTRIRTVLTVNFSLLALRTTLLRTLWVTRYAFACVHMCACIRHELSVRLMFLFYMYCPTQDLFVGLLSRAWCGNTVLPLCINSLRASRLIFSTQFLEKYCNEVQ